jgi:hypothetical protein
VRLEATRLPSPPAATPAALHTRALALRRPPAALAWLGGLALAWLLAVPAVAPWLDPRLDLWHVDDAKNHLIRIYHFTWLVERGHWFPRWVPDMFMGYGYPLFNFYAPALYYLAWALKAALRLDVWDAFRASGVVAALAGTAGVYALTHALWRSRPAAILAALILAYEPYVVQLNLFKRGDLPELLGLAVIPWLLYCLLRLHHAIGRQRVAWWLSAATVAGVLQILTHNITALTGAALAAVWVAYLLARTSRQRLPAALGRFVAAGALVAGVSAFFWLPAVGEGRLVHLEELSSTGGLDWRGWMVEPTGLTDKDPRPGNRQTRTGLIDRNLHYPHQLLATPKISLGQAGLGVLMLGTVVAAGLGRLPGRAPARPAPGGARHAPPGGGAPPAPPGAMALDGGVGIGPVALLGAIAVVCWYLTFVVSTPVWERLPGLALYQFPWRMLGPIGICLAAGGAGAVVCLAQGVLGDAAPPGGMGRRRRQLPLALCMLVGALFLFNSLGAREFPYDAAADRRFDARRVVENEQHPVDVGTTGNREFLPLDASVATYTVGYPRYLGAYRWLFPEGEWVGGLFTPLAGDLRIVGWRATPQRLSVRVANDATVAGALGIRQLQFAGWRAWRDGQRASATVAPYVPEQQTSPGFLVLAVPPGEHTLSLAFGPSALRLLAIGLSVFATLAWLAVTAAALTPEWRRRPARSAAPGAAWAPAGTIVPAVAVAAGAALVIYAGWRGLRPAVGRAAQLPAPTAAVSGQRWAAPDLAGSGQGLVVNLAEAVRAGQARVESPTGATLGPGRFVDVRQLTVTAADQLRGWAGTSRRQWLFLHPPSTVSVDVALPPRDDVRFQATLALDPAMWHAPTGDGVRFTASVAPAAGGTAERLVVDRVLNSRANQDDRAWVPVDADLSPWAGQTVRLTLRTDPRGELSFDWSGWANPIVYVRDSARDPFAR